MASQINYLTIDEVAKMLQVTRATIYKLQTKGLPFVKLGRAVRFDQDDVVDWLNSRKVCKSEPNQETK